MANLELLSKQGGGYEWAITINIENDLAAGQIRDAWTDVSLRHIDHDKTMLTAAILRVQSLQGLAEYADPDGLPFAVVGDRTGQWVLRRSTPTRSS